METACVTSFTIVQTPTTRFDRASHVPRNYILDLSMEREFSQRLPLVGPEGSRHTPRQQRPIYPDDSTAYTQRSQLQARESDRFLQVSPPTTFYST